MPTRSRNESPKAGFEHSKFQPSKVSFSAKEQALSSLKYLSQATVIVEKHLAAQEDVPGWVQTLIVQAASAMGMAVAYVRRSRPEERQP